MKKIIWVVIVVVAIILVIVFSGRKVSETGPIKIGFIAPMSGETASFGETERNAVQMAVDEINKQGGIDHRILEVVYEDGKCNGKDATSAIQKLINIDKVGIILGGACSSETLAIAPIAEQSKIVLFSAFSSNPEITNSGNYVFRNAPSDSDVAKLDAQYIAGKYSKVALISENTDYAQGVVKIMRNVFASTSVSIVSDESFGGGSTAVTDFRPLLTKILNTKPEVIYVNPTSPKSGGLIIKQARELGFKGSINGNFSIISPDSLAVAGQYAEGVTISDSTGLSEKGNSVLTKYKQMFKSEPSNEYELGASYDRVYILAQAISAVGTDNDKIVSYLYDMKPFEGAVGTYQFDKNGDVVGVGFGNYLFKDGKKVPVK